MAELHAPLPRDLAEFVELRSTIRQRGTARVWIAWASIAIWAPGCLVVLFAGGPPLFSLVPLLVLAMGFEAVYALHEGVERIGRYLQVFHESAEAHGWETVTMSAARWLPGGADPLFSGPFLAAAILNLLPAVLVGVPVELAGLGAAHALFVVRLALGRRAAARQRSVDLAGFTRFAEDRGHAPKGHPSA